MVQHATTHRHVAEQAIIDAWYAELMHQVNKTDAGHQDKYSLFDKVMPLCRMASAAMQGVRSMD